MKRLIVWVLLGLMLGLILMLASPVSAGCDPCTNFDQVIDPPQYLIHATGHGTTSGPKKDDWWFLFPHAPDSKGRLDLPDGEGGTFGYSTDHSSGPYTTPRAICAAATAAGQPDFVVTPWNWESRWHCKDLNGGGGGSPTATPTRTRTPTSTPTATPEVPEPTHQLSAWLDCGNSLDLPAGNPARPETCGIIVTGFRTNTSDDVTYTFPTLIPAQGVGEMLPGPIDVFPGNWSENPSNFLDSGSEHHTSPWLFARCPQTGVCTTATTPGTYIVPIVVAQKGAGAVTVNLTLTVGPSGGTGSATLGYVDQTIDRVGKYDFKPDGVQDARFHLIVSGGGKAITYLRLDLVDQNGSAIAGAPNWGTWPNPNNPGSYALGVYDWTTGQQINGPNAALGAAVPGQYQLLATDVGNGSSYFQSGQHLLLTIEFDNVLSSQIQIPVTIPAAGLNPPAVPPVAPQPANPPVQPPAAQPPAANPPANPPAQPPAAQPPAANPPASSTDGQLQIKKPDGTTTTVQLGQRTRVELPRDTQIELFAACVGQVRSLVKIDHPEWFENPLPMANDPAYMSLVLAKLICSDFLSANPRQVAYAGVANHWGFPAFWASAPVAQLQIQVEQGELGFEVTHDKAALDVETGTATVSAQGKNTFAVTYDPGTNISNVSVSQGQVTIQPKNPALASTTLQAGRQVTITQNTISSVMPSTAGNTRTANPVLPLTAGNTTPVNSALPIALLGGVGLIAVLGIIAGALLLTQPRARPMPYAMPHRPRPTDLPESIAQAAIPPARLVVVRGRANVASVDLSRGEVTIGRDPVSALTLADAGASRRHARVACENGVWVISDLGSRNGTFVNGKQITRCSLRAGDQIQIGQTVIAFQS